MGAFDFFDRVYVVHLPNVARRLHIEAQLSSIGYRDATYIHADAPPAGFKLQNMRRNPAAEFGANLSHVAAIVRAIADGAERPLFIEDDVTLREGAESRLASALRSLKVYDVLYLGGHPREPAVMAGDNLARVFKFSCAEAYSVNGASLPDLFAYWCNRISKPDAMIDFILGEFAAKRTSFCVYPVITEQAPFVSHIKGEVDDKRALVERGWRNNLSTK